MDEIEEMITALEQAQETQDQLEEQKRKSR
jgi:hypothetical protein